MSFFRSTCLMGMCVVAFSCSKKSTDEPSPEPSPVTKYGKITVHLHYAMEGEMIQEYGDNQVPQYAERKLTLDLAQVYLSKFELVKMDGSSVALLDTTLLKMIAPESYAITKVPVGKYKSIRFRVG